MAAEEAQRYYIHGDRHESDPQLYYCSACAMFFDKAHFWKYHVEANVDLYRSETEHLDKALSNGDYQRPPEAENLFA